MPKIKNFNELGTTELRKTALKIAEAGLLAIDTRSVIEKNVKVSGDSVIVGDVLFKVDGKSKIYLVGVGKCSSEAALAIEKILGDRLSGGIALDIKEPRKTGGKIKYYSGTHPFPSEKNVAYAGEIIALLEKVKENDLVIFVISGGGSTLLCLPSKGNTCVEEEMILKQLFSVGATIQEINTIRKHISHARGGWLAKYAYPARSVALIFSDVPGNDLGFVASGPTVKDETTIEDAVKILRKCGITWVFSTQVNLGAKHPSGRGFLVETPKENKYFEKVTNVLAVSNAVALEVMQDEAKKLGFESRVVTDRIEGEAREVGEKIVEELHKEPKRTVLLYGGETTVTVDKHGRGGRNGELALSALRFVEEGELVAAVASDGRDNGEYAGAIVDLPGRQKAELPGLNIEEYLSGHNPAPFFEQTGDYLMTGDTGSNVSDLLIAIKS
jgi:glycerate-2-kinase